MSMKQHMKNSVESFCEMLYEGLYGQFPEFMIANWQDKIRSARLAPTEPENVILLQQEGGYVQMRAAIADYYNQMNAYIDASDETAIASTGETVLQGGYALTVALTGSYPDLQKRMLTELNDKKNSLHHIAANMALAAAEQAEAEQS